MEKITLSQILARNIERAMVTNPNLDTQQKLAARSGVSQQHISRLLRCQGAATTDTLEGLAKAIRCEPWELLTDSQATREAAMRRMLLGDAVPDAQVERHLPLPPKARVAQRRAEAKRKRKEA